MSRWPQVWRARFQYQPLHEGLRLLDLVAGPGLISIPAPPRGASLIGRDADRLVDFNTSPSTRGFDKNGDLSYEEAISIPAPPRGASIGIEMCVRNSGISIPAPPRGASPVPR